MLDPSSRSPPFSATQSGESLLEELRRCRTLLAAERFEWDEAKASANQAKHGVSFPDAAHVFDDLSRLEWFDDREDYGEDRFVTIGLVEGREIVVVYTMRGDSRRLIMARRATQREREEYYGRREV